MNKTKALLHELAKERKDLSYNNALFLKALIFHEKIKISVKFFGQGQNEEDSLLLHDNSRANDVSFGMIMAVGGLYGMDFQRKPFFCINFRLFRLFRLFRIFRIFRI
jgi:hypothetical protein